MPVRTGTPSSPWSAPGVDPRSHVLVVAATRVEAAYVPTHLPLLLTGIGKTPAAALTAATLARHPAPEALTVLNVGTAGALRPGLDGLHEPFVVVNHDMNGDAVRALGHDPEERLQLTETPQGDPVVLATGDLFVTDPARRDELASWAHLVDMEGYAVAWVARQFGAHVRLVKHVSDNADESALEWTTAVDRSARILGEWLVAHV